MALTLGQIMQWSEQRALQAAFGSAAPATFTPYLALLTAAPSSGTDLTMAAETEYGASGYARQLFGTITGPTAASPAVVSNAGTITFGPFTSSPGTTITWAMLVDASSGTTAHNSVAYLLTSSRTPQSGDSLQAAVGAFTAQI